MEEFRLILDEVIANRAADFHSGFIAESPAKLRWLADYLVAANGPVDLPVPRCNAPWVSAVVEADGAVRPVLLSAALRKPG